MMRAVASLQVLAGRHDYAQAADADDVWNAQWTMDDYYDRDTRVLHGVAPTPHATHSSFSSA